MTVKAPPLSEAAFQAQIVKLAKLRGWFVYHPWLSVKSEPGWPDLTCVRDGRLIFMEVKSEKGPVSPAQERVQVILSAVAEVYVVRPSDWDFIERELR